jgi:hypothetical protein
MHDAFETLLKWGIKTALLYSDLFDLKEHNWNGF